MKKKLAAASALLVAFGLFACGGSNEPAESSVDQPTSSAKQENKHEHTFADTWESNDNYHWHPATCEHSEQTKGKAAHQWEEKVIKEADHESAGSKELTCKTCGAKKTEEIPAVGHDYVKTPASGKTYSYTKACSCGKGAVYGYEMTLAQGLKNGEKTTDESFKMSNGENISWVFTANKATKATLYFQVAQKACNYEHALWKATDVKYSLSINGGEGIDADDLEMNSATVDPELAAGGGESLHKAIWAVYAEVDLAAGDNNLVLSGINAEYRLNFFGIALETADDCLNPKASA